MRFCILALRFSLLVLFLIASPSVSLAEEKTTTQKVPGLQEAVEILRDRWGIAHIYAKNQHDLFFAQGYNAARDRLFQLEIWRRRVTGTMAEIQGAKALDRDIGARLLRFRLDLTQEMNHYHPQGAQIIPAFVDGINAYIKETEAHPELLPIEFRLLGITPQPWTPEIVISRIGGLFMNLEAELLMAQRVRAVGVATTKALVDLEPGNPDLVIAHGLDLGVIPDHVLKYYLAARASVKFIPEDVVVPEARAARSFEQSPSLATTYSDNSLSANEGSNNWVLRGTKTHTGHPIMANDPHRAITAPSLRYWVHLVAPGWNVIGGGEPHLPGISIGHNEHGAWGLTIFPTDSEDLYVYTTNPVNPNQYRYKGKWEEMTVRRETFSVKGQEPVTVDLKYTRHGPCSRKTRFVSARMRYARPGWRLARLHISRVYVWTRRQTGKSFVRRVPIPTPRQKTWCGLMSKAISAGKPRALFPADPTGTVCYLSLAMDDLNGKDTCRVRHSRFGPIRQRDFSPPRMPKTCLRATRMRSATSGNHRIDTGELRRCSKPATGLTLDDVARLQTDELSIPARTLVPLLRGLRSDKADVQAALEKLLSWDYVLNQNSVAAGIYAAWQQQLWENFRNQRVPASAQRHFPKMAPQRLLSEPHDSGYVVTVPIHRLVVTVFFSIVSLKQCTSSLNALGQTPANGSTDKTAITTSRSVTL